MQRDKVISVAGVLANMTDSYGEPLFVGDIVSCSHNGKNYEREIVWKNAHHRHNEPAFFTMGLMGVVNDLQFKKMETNTMVES